MPKVKIIKPKEAVAIAKSLVEDKFKEHFIGIYLDSYKRVVKTEVISIGSMTASIACPREIFRVAFVRRACSVILAHNHPSRIVLPSKSDIEITRQLVKAGRLLDISVIDHIIFSSGNKFYSFYENGLIK